MNTGQYDSCINEVHVDEKWWFISEVDQITYLVPGEKPPLRTCKHKKHIMKVMFLAATARPRYNDAGECMFDGKIDIWPFVEQVPAQRSSRNRPKGTLETKCITVTKKVYLESLILYVLPDIGQIR
jgi:hypothetical protein